MTAFFDVFSRLIVRIAPWLGVFLSGLILSLILTPICRELARKLGMVDKPSARRINKTPIPRSGGLAVFLSFTVVMVVFILLGGARIFPTTPNEIIFKMATLALFLVVVGLLDDKYGLPPLVKLF